MGLEVVVGFLIAWVARRAGHVGERVEGMVDSALDAGLDRVHALVFGKLGADPALERLELEAAGSGEVGTRTQARVRMALEEAVEEDSDFAAKLEEAVAALPRDGGGNVTITGGVHGSGSATVIGGITGGTVNIGLTDPSGPARA